MWQAHRHECQCQAGASEGCITAGGSAMRTRVSGRRRLCPFRIDCAATTPSTKSASPSSQQCRKARRAQFALPQRMPKSTRATPPPPLRSAGFFTNRIVANTEPSVTAAIVNSCQRASPRCDPNARPTTAARTTRKNPYAMTAGNSLTQLCAVTHNRPTPPRRAPLPPRSFQAPCKLWLCHPRHAGPKAQEQKECRKHRARKTESTRELSLHVPPAGTRRPCEQRIRTRSRGRRRQRHEHQNCNRNVSCAHESRPDSRFCFGAPVILRVPFRPAPQSTQTSARAFALPPEFVAAHESRRTRSVSPHAKSQSFPARDFSGSANASS